MDRALQNDRTASGRRRRGCTVRDLAVVVTSLLIAGSLLVSLTGATRDLSQVQVCANNLRQLFTGLTAYVNQYNCYPPHAPYPVYGPPYSGTGGWDPNMGWLLTYGLGIEPPARYADGHFKWYGIPYEELPEVCRCPAMSGSLLDPANPQLDQASPLETLLYTYALSYQTSGICRAACPVRAVQTSSSAGVGGRQPLIPDPASALSAKPYDNSTRGNPQGYFTKHKSGASPDDPTEEPTEKMCYFQAAMPAEVQCTGRVYFLADGRDYRPYNNNLIPGGGSPPAGNYNGYFVGNGNKIFIGSRHYNYANVMYLDGRVTRDNQTHDPMWNMGYDPVTREASSAQWRVSTFDGDIRVGSIRGQWAMMPVLMVRGWEAFFDANGMRAR
jgi:prepilin-type processing-associated H-X9-DG protein